MVMCDHIAHSNEVIDGFKAKKDYIDKAEVNLECSGNYFPAAGRKRICNLLKKQVCLTKSCYFSVEMRFNTYDEQVAPLLGLRRPYLTTQLPGLQGHTNPSTAFRWRFMVFICITK